MSEWVLIFWLYSDFSPKPEYFVVPHFSTLAECNAAISQINWRSSRNNGFCIKRTPPADAGAVHEQ